MKIAFRVLSRFTHPNSDLSVITNRDKQMPVMLFGQILVSCHKVSPNERIKRRFPWKLVDLRRLVRWNCGSEWQLPDRAGIIKNNRSNQKEVIHVFPSWTNVGRIGFGLSS